jgi:hypothetical protein
VPVIRRALPSDRSGVVATVAAAFAEDPGWAFILGEEYERVAAHFVAALFDVKVASQNVWVTDDLAAGRSARARGRRATLCAGDDHRAIGPTARDRAPPLVTKSA